MTNKSRAERFQIRRFTDLNAMKDEEYAYWQQQPTVACMQAVVEINDASFGIDDRSAHVRRLQRTLVRIERS